jgi:ketosteroid isomerase-like protein
MSTETTPQKQTPEDALRAANTRFYSAFESLDLAQMEAVWAHDDEVECVHPGWELLLGWDEVRERWARLFANARRVRIALSSVWLRIEGHVGWVACTEHVTTAFADGFDDAMVQATNIFVLHEEGWMLVAHHASPLPNPAHSTVQ